MTPTTIKKEELVSLAVKKLEDLVANKPPRDDSGTGGDNARYGVVSSTGKVEYTSHPCHSYMKYYKDPAVVYSQFVHHPKIDKEAERAFFDWITGPKSPWKPMVDRLSFDRDFQFKFGFIWDDLSHPANFQHNFLVVSRMPAEWPKDIERWYKWVKAGVGEATAFFFQTMFIYNTNPKGWMISRANKYDWPLDTATASKKYYTNFCNGKVEALIQPYSESQQYKPVNRIFGNNELAAVDDKVYGRTLYLKYWDKLGLNDEDCKKAWVGHTGLSKYDHRTHWLLTEEEVIKLMKLEEESLSVADVA